MKETYKNDRLRKTLEELRLCGAVRCCQGETGNAKGYYSRIDNKGCNSPFLACLKN